MDQASAGENFRQSLMDTRVNLSLATLVRHVSKEFGSSIALVTYIDEDTQWVLAQTGKPIADGPREHSFCRIVVESEAPLLVPDATQDPRFCASRLVTGEPHVRSYAGVPIRDGEGNVSGALCLLDERPDAFPELILETFQRYALGAEDMLRLHALHLESERLNCMLLESNSQLLRANRVFTQAEKAANIGSWELCISTGEIYLSDQARAILALPDEKSLTLESFTARMAKADHVTLIQRFEHAAKTRSGFEFETEVEAFNAEYARIRLCADYHRSSRLEPARLVGIIQDISSVYEAQAALEHAATHDSLTGLLNRHAFDRILRDRLRLHRQQDEEVMIMLLDLDGFKDINDTFGHVTGDLVLAEVAERLIRGQIEGSVIARWGGDEFVVVFPVGSTVGYAVEAAQNLIAEIAQRTEITSRPVTIGATCGLARSTSQMSARELVRRADTALYEGKKRDPGGVHVYNEELEDHNIMRVRAISQVREAIADGRLFPAYQPIVNLNTGSRVGCEALLRLTSRDESVLTASAVLPALIDPLTGRQISKQMLELISADLPEIFRSFPNLRYISVNATEGDLLRPAFASEFLAVFGAHDIDFERITLEVTETMLLVNDARMVKRTLEQLSEAGVQIALDDFGTGFSSLSHLRDFPIDKVKIDGSFVQQMNHHHGSRLIIQAIVGMARNMNIEVIAEGIETDEQRGLLLAMGCEFGQGYLFSHAISLPQMSLEALRNAHAA